MTPAQPADLLCKLIEIGKERAKERQQMAGDAKKSPQADIASGKFATCETGIVVTLRTDSDDNKVR